MEEIYQKLNYYLNDICSYLNEDDSFLLDNIYRIGEVNDSFFGFIYDYSLENEVVQNHLTYEDVYFLAREIIEHIDSSYLESFDKLIANGELDFGYDDEYDGSECLITYDRQKQEVKTLINISREFNYNDVRLLVHEFIHYTNAKKYSTNFNYLAEFLAIYFEFYAIDYLLDKGVNREEIDYLYRIKAIRRNSNSLFKYEIILLAYLSFGNLDSKTFTLLQKYLLNEEAEYSEKDFEKECTDLCKRLSKCEEENKDILEDNPKKIGYILGEEIMAYDYKYLLGTFLTILARKYSDLDSIVYLNNHIFDYNDKSVYEICLSIGIDISDKDLISKLLSAMEEYIISKEPNCKKVRQK